MYAMLHEPSIESTRAMPAAAIVLWCNSVLLSAIQQEQGYLVMIFLVCVCVSVVWWLASNPCTNTCSHMETIKSWLQERDWPFEPVRRPLNKVLFDCLFKSNRSSVVFQPLEYQIQQSIFGNSKVIDQKDPVTPVISLSPAMTHPQKYVGRHG